MNTEEMIEVLRADMEGKDIERMAHNRSSSWEPHSKDEGLNYRDYVYRIVKQLESIEVEIWKHQDDGLTISVTSQQSVPSSLRGAWKLLKTVTIEV